MDQYIINFMKELGANLFLVKNFFFFVESFTKGLFQIKTMDLSGYTVMGCFAFWQSASQYFQGLYQKQNNRSIYHFIDYLNNHPELIPNAKRQYFDAISNRVKSYPKVKVTKPYNMNLMFDDIVFSHMLYVNLCNLYSISQGDRALSFNEINVN